MNIFHTTISMVRGDSEAIRVSCIDKVGVSVPFITGDIVYFTVKENTNTDTKILQKIVTEFTEGIALISILPLDTRTLKVKTYCYDIQLNKVDGTVKTIIEGSKFVLKAEVTYD